MNPNLESQLESSVSTLKEAVNIDTAVELSKLIEQTDFDAIVLPTGYSMESTEKFQEKRNIFTGRFKTSVISELVSYSLNIASLNAKCFIDANEMEAKVIYDLGTLETPLHAKNRAYCSLVKTSDFKAVQAISERFRSKKDIAEFIEDFEHNISIIGATGEKMTVSDASHAVRNINVEAKNTRESSVNQFAESQSEYASLEAKTAGTQLPAVIQFTCAPYSELESRTFNLRVSINSDSNIKLAMVRFDKHVEEMAEEFSKKVRNNFSDSGLLIPVFIGTFDI